MKIINNEKMILKKMDIYWIYINKEFLVGYVLDLK